MGREAEKCQLGNVLGMLIDRLNLGVPRWARRQSVPGLYQQECGSMAGAVSIPLDWELMGHLQSWGQL